MLTEIKNVADGALKGAVQSAGGNFIHNKAAELIKTKFIDPKQISSIKEQLRTKFGTQSFYNDFDAYITENKTIDRVFEMFYNVGKTTVLSGREFVTQNLDSFSNIYPQYGWFDLVNIKECFEIIYNTIYESCIRLNPHTDLGKLQLSQAIYADQLHSEHEELGSKIDLILSKVNSMMPNSNDLAITSADLECASEAIKAYLKDIDSVGSESCPIKNDFDAIEKYQRLLANVPIVLRGESTKQIDVVLCSLEAHLAIRHSNLGRVKEAFDCLDVVPGEVAETSKLYHFVRAMIIVGHHITDKFSDAEYSIKRALELDNEYHRAFLVGQLLVALRKEVEKDVIISDLDSRFSTILTENKNKELIADYYAFRGLVCKEFYDYDEAEQDYKLAKEYGYDETIADLNIGILYYCQATSTLPKNERLYCFDIDVALIYRTIELFKNYLFGEKELSPHARTRMVEIYVSCCGLIGAKHGLSPVNEYVCLPNLDYETIRTLLLGYDGIIDDKLLTLLTPEDQFNVRIANCAKKGCYDTGKTIFCDLSPEEISVLHVSTIYLILQACVANKDLETYKKFRCYILDSKERVMLDCLDAYALELEGDIENATQKVEIHSVSSFDYKVLCNILMLYLRNDCREDANKLFIRILNLYKEKKLHIEDKFEFFQLAVGYFVKQKSIKAKLFIDAFELDNEKAWLLKADYYTKVNDVHNLSIALNWLCENSFQYNYGLHKVVCLIKLMKYEEALLAAESLLETIHENNIKDKTDVLWLISNIYLFMDNEEQSYEWAKKAHELTSDTPNDKSHQAFFSRAIRTGRIDESFGEIIEYRKIHPVIVSDWMKEIQIPEEATGEELIHALDEATGYSHEDYEEIENQFVSLYKTNSFVPNSVVLKHYGNDYVRFFWFASNHKLRVSNGSWNNIQAKQKLIEEHVFVDSLTLILLQHYGCLDAIKEIPHVHICYSTLEVIQNNYQVWSASADVREILLWVKNATNVVFEPDGYVFESSLSSLFEEEYIKCCRCAATNDIPLLTIETSIEDFSKMEEQGSFKNIQTVGVVSLCHATLSKTPEKLNKTLYNLLGHCTFINFHAETIVAQIISNDYVVDKSALARFFICNTSCDMISFERVYFGTLMSLFSEHRDAAIDFAMIVLENAVSIWRKGTHYRFLVERFNDEEARVKSESILRYLVLLLYDFENTFKDGIPKKIQGLYENIRKSIYKHFGNKMIQEIKSSFVFLDD